MLTFRRTTATAIVALSLALAACGDDFNADPAAHPAGLLTAGDFNVNSTGSETSNLMFALQEAGFPLDTTSAEDSTSIAGLIAGKDLLFLPEVTPNFDNGTRAILHQFVNAGGTIVLVGGYEHVDWVNETFGFHLALTEDFYLGRPMARVMTPGTGELPGPATIPGNDGGTYLNPDSLPRGATAIYMGENGSRDVSVAVLRAGNGRLIYFGWDWYNGAPKGTQDGGWRKLLRATALP